MPAKHGHVLCHVLPATCRRGGSVRLPRHVFSGRSAKELSVAVLEPQAADTPQPLPWCSRLEHANYLVGVAGAVRERDL